MMREWPENCKMCGTFRLCQNPAIDGKGDRNAKTLCLFEAPGKDEDADNEILVGPAGRRLREILDTLRMKTGIDLSTLNARWENVVMCYPVEEKTPKMDTIRFCREFWVEKAMAMPNLERVICFGRTALSSVLDQAPGKIERWRQQAIRVPEFPGWLFFATYHPAYTLGHRNPQAEKWMLEDLEFAAKCPLEEEPRERDDAIWLPEDGAQSEKSWWILNPSRPYIAWDIEHTGDKKDKNSTPWPSKDGKVADLKLVCWNTRMRQGSCRLDYGPIDGIFASELRNAHQTHIVFKATHDIPWMTVNYGLFPAGKLYDPMIAYQLLDENYPDKSLEGICKRVFNATPWKKEFWSSFSWDDPDWESLIDYCKTDVLWTTRLAFWTAERLVEEGLDKLFVHEMVNRLVTIEGICHGVVYDQPEAATLRASLELEAEAFHQRAAQLAGREINLNAPAQILEVLRTMQKRVPDTSTPVLRRWLWRDPGNEFVRLILSYRRLQSQLRYLTHYNNTVRQDGRFHADMEPMTETGRYRCSGPNLMNVMR